MSRTRSLANIQSSPPAPPPPPLPPTGGSTPLDLSGSFKIPKRPAQYKGQGPARKRSRRRRFPAQPAVCSWPASVPGQTPATLVRGAVGAGVGPGPNEEEPGPVGGRLGGHNFGQMGPTNCPLRLPYRVHRELPVNQSTSVDKNPVKAQALCSSRRGPTQDAAKEGDSSTRPLHDRARVLFLPILGGEALGAHFLPQVRGRWWRYCRTI